MDKLKQFMLDFPTTPYRVLMSTVGYLSVLVARLAFNVVLEEEFYDFLLWWAFIDVAQFGLKRATYRANDVPSDSAIPPAA